MTELMMTLLLWISAHTGYAIPADLPKIKFGTGAELSHLICGGESPSCKEREFWGAYDPRTETVYLRNDWSRQKERLGDLVHELVHYLQDKNGRKFPCRGAAEYEAYTIENKWYEENNIQSPYDPAFMLFAGIDALCMGY